MDKTATVSATGSFLQNPQNIFSLISGVFNPAQIGVNLGISQGVKTGEAAAEAGAKVVTNTVEAVKTGVGKTLEGIGGAVSTFTLNFGLVALIGILFIGLFTRATR